MSKIEEFLSREFKGHATARLSIREVEELITLVREECNQWIPVSERLPKKSAHNQYSRAVTVYCERSKCQYAGCYDHETECWVLFSGVMKEISGVTHWQPQRLPPAK